MKSLLKETPSNSGVQQEFLFEHVESDLLSGKAAAALLNVSDASINNWIKAGYLKKSKHRGYLTKESFDEFSHGMVGSEKLNARANKQHAKSHNHAVLSSEILSKVWEKKTDKKYGDWLAHYYEKMLSDGYKNKEGIYYTPLKICQALINRVGLSHKTPFCDPCCGTGNFLIAALEGGVLPENLTGYDVDAVALEIAKRRIFDRTGCNASHLFVADFLSLPHNGGHEVVMTNPPWGKKYSKQQKQEFSEKLGLSQSRDSCSLFTKALLNFVKEGGKIGMVLPQSFFNVKSFQEIRRIVLTRKMECLIDLGKAFEGLVTKAHAVVLTNEWATSDEQVDCISATHPQEIFSKNPFSIINFNIHEAEAHALATLLKKSHTTLKDKARWGLGIVTGNNKKHLLRSPQEDCIAIFKGSDLSKGSIKKPTSYIQEKLDQYQQVAPLELYKAPCKIIYKFISSDIVFFCDEEQRFLLNSANMLVVDEQLLVKTHKLVHYFNLDLINWFHKKMFNTHKILRSNLECVPIYLDYLKTIPHPSNLSLLDYLGLEKINGTYRVKK